MKNRTKCMPTVRKLCSRSGNWIAKRWANSFCAVDFRRCNYRAVCRAKSNSDFINKLRIVEEECDESLFWMELLVDNNCISFAFLV